MKRKRETTESESRENAENGNQDLGRSEEYIQTCLKISEAFETINKHMSLPPYNRGIAFLILDYFLIEFNKARKAHKLRNESHYEDLSELLKDYKVIFETSLDNIQKDIINLSLEPKVLFPFLKSALTFPIGKFILEKELKDDFEKNRRLKRIQFEIARALNFHTGNCVTYSALLFHHLQKLKLKDVYIIGLKDVNINCNGAHFIIVVGACRDGQIFSSLKKRDCIIVDGWSGKIYLSCEMDLDKEIWKDYREATINIYASTNDGIDFSDYLLDQEKSEKAEEYINDIANKFLETLNVPMPRERIINRAILEEAEKHAASFDLDDILDHSRHRSIEESRKNLTTGVIAFAWERCRSKKMAAKEGIVSAPSFTFFAKN